MLLKAVESVINQTYRPYEVIVVDDGSNDGTALEFPIEGVIFIQIDHDGHPGFVRNRGVENSTGDYIAFLDSDDIWMTDKLERQVEYYKSHKNCRILHTKERWVRNDKVISQKKRKHKKSGNVFKESLQGCILGPSTVLMDKKLYLEFDGFNSTIEVGEDYDLWLRITGSVDVDYLDEELIIKNAGHGDQLSFKYGFIEPFKIDVLESLIKEDSFSPENRELAIDALKNKYEIIINGCKKRGKDSEAQLYIDRRATYFS